MKLWGGRFEKTTDAQTDDFHSSIAFDQRLYREDIEGSIAHANMLGAQGIIPAEDAEKIIGGLKAIQEKIEQGSVAFDPAAEDIHMNIEKLLIEEIGETGKRLHTGRSRNDQVALDMKLYTKREISAIEQELNQLLSVLCALGEQNIDTIMPGYTHLQKAQPVTLAHHVGAYIEMFRRDLRRLRQCVAGMNESPLGSGALATTTYPLDRRMTAKALGFDSIMQNSMDGVSDRDYAIELLSDLSILMMHLSRFCEELILWSTNEFCFIELDDAYATGSSIMPQKKNPDMAELIRGKTGRVYGDLMGLLTVMKGLPLAYNKDMQEDKEAVFDAIDTVKLCLPVFTGMLQTMKVNTAQMREGAKGGFTNATDAADWLVKKGVAFRDAHEIIGRLVLYAIRENKPLEALSLAEYRAVSDVFDENIYSAISLKECVEKRLVEGGPSKNSMTQYYQQLSDQLSAQEPKA